MISAVKNIPKTITWNPIEETGQSDVILRSPEELSESEDEDSDNDERDNVYADSDENCEIRWRKRTEEAKLGDVARILLDDGVVYEGSLINDIPNGHGKYTLSNGCFFEGTLNFIRFVCIITTNVLDFINIK